MSKHWTACKGVWALLLCGALAAAFGVGRAAEAPGSGEFVCLGRYPQRALGTEKPPGAKHTGWESAPDAYAGGENAYYAVEPLVWRVLEVREGTMLLLSEYILDVRPYQDPLPSVDWANCTLRGWLNGAAEDGGFLARAFSGAERERMRPAATGGAAGDPVFCLSPEQADLYFPVEGDRAAHNTDYSAARTKLHADYWWLRTPPGGEAGFAAYIDDRGMFFPGTHHVFFALGVRPATWVRLPEEGFAAGDGTFENPYSFAVSP